MLINTLLCSQIRLNLGRDVPKVSGSLLEVDWGCTNSRTRYKLPKLMVHPLSDHIKWFVRAVKAMNDKVW